MFLKYQVTRLIPWWTTNQALVLKKSSKETLAATASASSTTAENNSDRTGTGTTGLPVYEIISPALLENDQWPFTLTDLMQIALAPPPLRLGKSSVVYQTLFDCGVETVKKWAATTERLKEYQQTAEQIKDATVLIDN